MRAHFTSRAAWHVGRALALFTALAPLARADIVVLVDGSVLPSKSAEKMVPDTDPDLSVLEESGKNNLELGAGTVSISGKSVDAGLVRTIYCTEALFNPRFNNGLNQATAQYWPEAAASFATAADGLEGADRQVALWNRIVSLRNTSDLDAVATAVQEFLREFPDGYYMPQARILHARILINKKQGEAAQKDLAALASDPSVNARDRYEAAVSAITFFTFTPAKDSAGFQAAEKAYRALLAQMRAEGVEAKAVGPALRARLGIARALIQQRKPDEANPLFEEVAANALGRADPSLWASAYRGLGDVIYLGVSQAIAGGATAEKKEDLLDRLTQAAVHYLRVTTYYRESAGDDFQPALQSLAEIWQWQFELGGSTDFRTADRSLASYRDALQLMPRGPARNELLRHAREFLQHVEELKGNGKAGGAAQVAKEKESEEAAASEE